MFRLESNSLHVGSLFYLTNVVSFITLIIPFFRPPTHAAEFWLEVTNDSFQVK